MHQPRRSPSSHGEAVILQLARHPRTAISAVRQRERGSNVCQQHHVIALTPTGWPIFPCKIATLTDAEHSAKTVDGELVFRLIDELELHRLPSLAKKSSGLLQNVAFLTEDLVLPAEPLQLGCHVLRSRLLWSIDLAVAIPGNPAGQRRQANTQIFSQFTPRASGTDAA